jgi:hypothetical protein
MLVLYLERYLWNELGILANVLEAHRCQAGAYECLKEESVYETLLVVLSSYVQ